MVKVLQCIPVFLKGSRRIIVAVACFDVDNFRKNSQCLHLVYCFRNGDVNNSHVLCLGSMYFYFLFKASSEVMSLFLMQIGSRSCTFFAVISQVVDFFSLLII